MTEFELIRTFFYEDKTFGELYFNDVHICDTREGEDRYMERWKTKKFLYNTAIPRGIYDMSFYSDEGKLLYYPIIKNVPQFYNVEIVNNCERFVDYEYRAFGSILVGKIDGDWFDYRKNEAFHKIKEIYKLYGNDLKISVL